MENERKITAMGMAAGQARLLSITARMSDNELRAQIINNDKMRLATESSQVSDHYVQALNEAELMFTNYDENNNASFKQLTFNALTAYNPYNNQYALTNASGNILLSETDYKNYEKCKNLDNGLEEFLKCYGLEQTTTFFDNLATIDGSDNGIVVFTNPNVQDDPSTPINETTSQSTGLTREQLKLAYLGNEEYKRINALTDDQKITLNKGVDVIPQGYNNVANLEKYNEYFRYLDKYNQKWDEYLGCLSDVMAKTLDEIVKSKSSNRFNTIKALTDAIDSSSDMSDMKNIMQNLKDIIEETSKAPTYSLGTAEVKNFYRNDTTKLGLWNLINDNMYDSITASYTIDPTQQSPQTVGGKFVNYIVNYDNTATPPTISSVEVQKSDGSSIANVSGGNTSTPFVANDGTKNHNMDLKTVYDSVNKKFVLSETIHDANTLENMQSVSKTVSRALKNSLANCWDPLSSKFTSQEPAATYYQEYKQAAQDLADIIYGVGAVNVSPTSNPKLEELGNISLLYNNIGSNYPQFIHDTSSTPPNDFYQIYLNIVLDNVQDTYGEPYFTWIDTSYPTASYNENGEAKAQWYENIWNMCQKNGCKVLKDGLASSTEWIQYAFDSGIVNMQQVDTNGNWNSLIYTNCSDITSQTSDKIIAKAEAEYNAAMKKIENKDKRYDLELKNIDTEHNSLQTEYESIKSALDKHIDRVFKLYS